MYTLKGILEEHGATTTLLDEMKPDTTYSKKDLEELTYQVIKKHNPQATPKTRQEISYALPLWLQSQQLRNTIHEELENTKSVYKLRPDAQNRP